MGPFKVGGGIGYEFKEITRVPVLIVIISNYAGVSLPEWAVRESD